MTWRPFLALPNYLGGKRKLTPLIFREVGKTFPRRAWPELTLLDPFAGGCSVDLYAKAQGLRVICGDIAERSYIVQQALIANDAETLSAADLGLLFQKRNGYNHFVAEHLTPNHFPLRFAQFLDLALANIADHPSATRQALLKLLLYKAMLGPVIHHGITILSRATDSEALESLPAHNAKRIEPWWLTPPPIIAQRLARSINPAVFGNGHEHLVHQADARDLVEQYADQADIVYIDPPYPLVCGYEAYRVLDSVFAGQWIPRARSAWSTAEFSILLLDLLEKAQEIPLWIISYGSVGVTLHQLTDLVETYRPVEAIVIDYPHLQAIARPEVAEANQEYLLVAKKG